jgi:hypothetical protein
MATCEICGTQFDELGVQIVVPGLAKSFDRIDCARRARAIAGPPAFSVKPLPAVFVDVAPRGDARSYGLPGLPAGVAAALAGGRARLALGGATVAVALLAAATVHLSWRTDGGSDVGASVLPSPSRHAGNLAFRGHTVQTLPAKSVQALPAKASAPVVVAPAPQETDGVYLIAERHAPAKLQRRPRKPHTAKHSRSTRGITLTRTAESVSTRRGWGWGDKNHAHGGPAKGGGSAKAGSAHGRRHK